MQNLKKLKITSLYKLIFPFLLYVITSNIIISLLLLVLLINKDYKYYFIVLIIILLTFLLTLFKNYYNIATIISNDNSTCTVENLLYKGNLYNCEYEIGDVIIINDKEDISNETSLKYNELYIINSSSLLFNNPIRKNIYYLINNNSSDHVKSILNKIFYESNDYEYLYSGIILSCSFYYLLKFIYEKSNNKIIILSLLFIYYLLFGFNIKLYLIFFIFKSKNKNLDLIKQFFLIFILNRYLLLNYVILISVLYRLIYSFNFKFNPFIIISSYLFNCINVLKLFIFKYLIKFNIILFIVCFFNIFIDINFITEFIYNISYKILSLDKYLTIRGKISFISILLFLIIIKGFKVNKKFYSLILILLIISPFNNGFTTLTFINVGQGDSALINIPYTYSNILIDTGSTYNYSKLKNYLYSKGVYHINKLLISHNDSDHNGNIDNLKNDFIIDEIVDYKGDVEVNNIKLNNLDLGSYDNDNDNSLVYYVNINNISFLFTGDISQSVENKLIDLYGPIHVDIIKLAHHGSKTSSSYYFLSNLNPKLAIISTSGQYGHPSSETLDTLDKLLIDYLSTKEVGSIEFIFTKFINFIKYDNKYYLFYN